MASDESVAAIARDCAEVLEIADLTQILSLEIVETSGRRFGGHDVPGVRLAGPARTLTLWVEASDEVTLELTGDIVASDDYRWPFTPADLATIIRTLLVDGGTVRRDRLVPWRRLIAFRLGDGRIFKMEVQRV